MARTHVLYHDARLPRSVLWLSLAGAAIFLGSLWHSHRRDDAPAPVSIDQSRQVIAVATIVNNRCHVPGFANNAPFVFNVDTGDPNIADFSASALGKLGLRRTLNYRELQPGTRYGGYATARLRELRIGAWVLNDIDVGIFEHWRFAFGDDETPLLGLAALQNQGVRLEVENNICRLTLPHMQMAGAKTVTKKLSWP